jgi:hypothetical protein
MEPFRVGLVNVKDEEGYTKEILAQSAAADQRKPAASTWPVASTKPIRSLVRSA